MNLLAYLAICGAGLAGITALILVAGYYINHETGGRYNGDHTWLHAPEPLALDCHQPMYAALEVHHERLALPASGGVMAGDHRGGEPTLNLPGPVPEGARDIGQSHRAGELTPNQRAGYWQPSHRDLRSVLAPWVAKALEHATISDTSVDTDHDTFTRWLHAVVGGDPLEGRDITGWCAQFDVINTHAQLALTAA